MSPQKPQKQLGSPVKLRPFKTETDLESAASRVPDDDDSLGDSDQEPARKRSRLGSDAEGDKVVSNRSRLCCFSSWRLLLTSLSELVRHGRQRQQAALDFA